MNSYFNYWYIKFIQKIVNIFYKFKFPIKFCDILSGLVERYIQNKLKSYFNESMKLIKNSNLTNNSENPGIIWVFWWQGINKMPSIVKLCLESIKRHSGEHQVILIDKNNVSKYTDIPNYIYDKLNDDKITLTHFSDILRFNLLKNNGGLWIDSTVYCSNDLSEQYFGYLYTSGRYNNTFPKFVAGRWTGFLIGGEKNNPLFIFMDKYFRLYWKDNNYQIDYFLIDQGLYYAYNHDVGNFKYYVDNFVINNNPHLFGLVDCLNDYYDDYIYNNLTKDTDLFKLTYKKKFYLNGTFYAKLIEKYF